MAHQVENEVFIGMITSPCSYNSMSLYMKDVEKYPILPAEEIKELARRKGEDPKALEKIIVSNLRLVLWQAKKFSNSGLPQPDIIAAGNMGLIKAAECYDPEKACFSTYAVPWILQRIRRAITKTSHEIREPEHVQLIRRKITMFVGAYRDEHGTEPSHRAVAEGIRANIGAVKRIREKTTPITFLSLDYVGENERSIAETLADSSQSSPSETAESVSLYTAIDEHLDKILPAREAEIMRMRFGMGGDDPKSLGAISDNFGMTGERVRQILKTAITKVRKSLSADEYSSLKADLRSGYGIMGDIPLDDDISDDPALA